MSTPIQSSWADEIEEGDANTLPPITEKIQGNKKIITEYAINDDGKKIKIVQHTNVSPRKFPNQLPKEKPCQNLECLAMIGPVQIPPPQWLLKRFS